MDSEQEVRLHFLDEANDYLAQIESGVLGLSKPTQGHQKNLDSTLRAAHSIKGGAAMMGYETLRELAHRLEDFLKVIRSQGTSQVDAQIERLLLESVDCLRSVIDFYHQGKATIEQTWLEANVTPLFTALHSHLGDPKLEDTARLVTAEAGEGIIELLFHSEVDNCLQRLEEVLHSSEQLCLKEEFILAAQELGGLGEMLELKSFSRLCADINQHLNQAHETEIAEIAQLSLQAWRRSQALVLVGQINQLPSHLDLARENGKTPLADFEVAAEAVSLDLEEFGESLENFSFLSEEEFQKNHYPLAEGETSLQTSWLNAQESTLSRENTTELDASIVIDTVESDNTVRVAVKQLEQLGDQVGELTIERNMLNLQLSSLRDLLNLLKTRVKTLYQSNTNLRTLYDQTSNWETQKQAEKAEGRRQKAGGRRQEAEGRQRAEGRKQRAEGYENLSSPFDDDLEMDRYGEVHLFMQELMEKIVQIQEVTEDIDLKLEDAKRQARNLTRSSKLLQDHVTKVRMRPFSDLVQVFPRAIREMELRYEKQVQLKIGGSSTLIDRTILEALKDPLIHLLRNAFDHGIEKPNERLKKGKLPVGTIELSAVTRGNQTIITLRDDGAGIDFNKIRLAAFEMGLEESMLVQASQKELLDLIFEPGFTTASEVSALSGRGVGMDIVRTQVKQIRGQIQIDTLPGEGTTVIISVPFTLSVVRAMLLESGGIIFAFPSSGVDEMLIADSQRVVTNAGIEYLRTDESMIPLYNLPDWLHFSRPYVKPQTDAIATINQPVILIVTQNNETVALQMDAYWGEQEISIRTIEGPIKLPTGFTGCTILGDGRVVPLVEPSGLLSLIEQRRSGNETAVPWTEPEPRIGSSSPLEWEKVYQFDETLLPPSIKRMALDKATVMVVDDSINIRRFLALTLEKAGYQVQQAKDGQEALDKLKKGLPISAVICDLEMPRLDGYGFLAYVKSDPSLRSLPVIILTSRSGDKHQQLAFNLGASAYFTKPFQAQELLQSLKSMM